MTGTPAQTGQFQFTVQVQDADGGVATRQLTLNITAAKRDLKVSAVVNGGSFTPDVAPGMWISIFGTDLNSQTSGAGRKWADQDFAGGSLPVALDGTSVKINGIPAPISWVGSNQLNILVPDGDYTGPVPVEITDGDATVTTTATVRPVAPALFVANVNDRNYAATVDVNGIAIGPSALPGSRKAKPGEVLMVFGTGFGPTNPAVVTSLNMSPAPLALPFRVEIGGVEAACQYGGLVGPGLNQFNVVVPALPPGEYPIVDHNWWDTHAERCLLRRW